jgi:LmbE family N-acetylglucosaminyl deacetylase
MSRVLIMAAHPDDETLGCGGTLLKHKSQGDQIHWCIVTAMSRSLGYSDEQISQREKEISQVKEDFGFDQVSAFNLPAAGLDSLDIREIIGPVSELFQGFKPDTLYLPFKWDVHSDHRALFQAAWSSAKVFRAPFIKRILMMETLSETESAPPFPGQSFFPNCFVDITAFMDQKIQIMKRYPSEIRPPPFPRSEEAIRSLAGLRGAAAGCTFAEAFMVLREIR